MVPGCPPGLFTKVFAEAAPPIEQSHLNVTPPTRSVDPAIGDPPPPPPGPPTPTGYGPAAAACSPHATRAPHTFPYLVDNFFYTGPPSVHPAGSGPAGSPRA